MHIISRQLCKTVSSNHHYYSKKGQHKVVTNGKAPTEDRRDDMRFQLRAKISQKDYVDKQMRAFHYNQEIAQK